jgi:hypothetical protein
MLNRRNWMLSLVSLMLVAILAGCVGAAVAVPNRTVDVNIDTALAAQGKLGNLMMGSVEWSESEFSSLLSVLLEQNSGENNPVDAVHVWFEPNNQVVVRVALKPGVLPFGNTLDLAGSIAVEANHVVVDINQAGAGNMSISGVVLDGINGQINAALADPQLGVAANVETSSGMIKVSLGGM